MKSVSSYITAVFSGSDLLKMLFPLNCVVAHFLHEVSEGAKLYPAI